MPGNEVLIQSYMCIADTEAIVQIGAVPVFCDIDRNNYGVNLDSIEQYITPKTKAMLAIHYGGYMLNMEKVHEIAKRHNIEVVEDASLTHGGEWNHTKVGNFSKLTIFSLGIDKLMTVGEGGIIITNDSGLADLCSSLRNSGNIACIPTEIAKDRALSEFTDIKRIGWNFRLTELPSAVGLEGLKKLPYQIARRNENGLYLDEKLKEIGGIELLKRDERQNLQPHGLYLFRIVKNKFGIDKQTFIKAVNAEGIPVLYGYHNPIYGYSVFQKEERYKNMCCPESERACDEGIWLSQAVLLGTREDMDDIVRAFAKVKENVDKLKNMGNRK
jgi:dTDP-4-amino-4,6-dideoxygalactose transaminase